MIKAKMFFYIGRHSAENLAQLLTNAIEEYDISHEKVFMVVRDAANTMKAVTRQLGFFSTDCFSHKINLVSCFYFAFFSKNFYNYFLRP
jgi:hypothetical protein